jgi:hypothetical protein
MGAWSYKQWLGIGNIHVPEVDLLLSVKLFFCIFFCGLECVCHFFAYVAHFEKERKKDRLFSQQQLT